MILGILLDALLLLRTDRNQYLESQWPEIMGCFRAMATLGYNCLYFLLHSL